MKSIKSKLENAGWTYERSNVWTKTGEFGKIVSIDRLHIQLYTGATAYYASEPYLTQNTVSFTGFGLAGSIAEEAKLCQRFFVKRARKTGPSLLSRIWFTVMYVAE